VGIRVVELDPFFASALHLVERDGRRDHGVGLSGIGLGRVGRCGIRLGRVVLVGISGRIKRRVDRCRIKSGIGLECIHRGVAPTQIGKRLAGVPSGRSIEGRPIYLPHVRVRRRHIAAKNQTNND
jgi:hypothetical protein